MYFNINFNVFFKLIKVHLLVSELYISECTVQRQKLSEVRTKMYIGLRVKCPLILLDFNVTWNFCWTDF